MMDERKIIKRGINNHIGFSKSGLFFEFNGPAYLTAGYYFFLKDITHFNHFCPVVEFFQVNYYGLLFAEYKV